MQERQVMYYEGRASYTLPTRKDAAMELPYAAGDEAVKVKSGLE